MIKVESGIKIPKVNRSKGTTNYAGKYPFAKMKVGDSFFVQASRKRLGWNRTKDTTLKMASVNAACRAYRTKFNLPYYQFAITCRTVDRGIRIWRIK